MPYCCLGGFVTKTRTIRDWPGEAGTGEMKGFLGFCFLSLEVESEQKEVSNGYLFMLKTKNYYHTWFHLYAWLTCGANERCK